MKRSRSHGLCCGAGGAQVFKEEEKGSIRINEERSREAINTGAKVIASNCPYCMMMLNDGVKANGKEESVEVIDLAELIAGSME